MRSGPSREEIQNALDYGYEHRFEHPPFSQKQVLLDGEADRWLERNRDKLGQHDPVSEMIEQAELSPGLGLEIGCANRWRIEALNQHGWQMVGVDPGYDGCTADRLPFISSHQFKLVIFGFCLYLCDPCDYFKIASEADRVLQDGGHLIIHDFWSLTPFTRPYEHDIRLKSHHHYWPSLWTGSPAYKLLQTQNEGEEAVWLLKKDLTNAFQMEQPNGS